ncbi:MAG: TRAP transporter fused permease subunit [Acetobacteraceae bacterium]|nr:TRAP transporter fused permease subunit [Acetobacteraceae bacterium]
MQGPAAGSLAPADSGASDIADVDDMEFATHRRTLGGPVGLLVRAASIAFVVFHLVVLLVWPINQDSLRAIHVFAGAALGFAVFMARAGDSSDRVPLRDWLLIGLCGLIAAHFVTDADAIEMRTFMGPNTRDLVLMSAGVLVVLEFTRRTAGIAMPIIAVVFLAYVFVGPWMPGVLYHRGVSFGEALIFVATKEGVLGTITGVSSTFIIMFVTFAAFLQASKAGDFFNDLAVAAVGWARGGPAKVTVISGALFGTISGSAVANVVASGAFTIPMMRRVGYDRATAAAVEATSSTGGQITPPVMGAGAFIMAEVLGLPYADIAVAGIIPALLFYVANYAHCDLNARRNGLMGLPREELPRWLPLLGRTYMVAPLALLVWGMLEGYSPFRSAALGLAAALVIMLAAPFLHMLMVQRLGLARSVAATLSNFVRDVAGGLESATRECLQLVAVCAAAGIIGGVINLTGVGGRFANLLLQIAGDFSLLAMLFTMIVVGILGMGVPTTAAYAIGAAVVAPGLIRLGVEPLTAHMFIFYFAVLSAITPPVALASFAAAGMAGADLWRTSLIALKLGLATFIVPFMFWLSPLLLAQGPLLGIIQAVVTAAFGVVLLACATEGWMLRALGLPLRLLAAAGALMLMIPEGVTDAIGLCVFAFILGLQYATRARPVGAQ